MPLMISYQLYESLTYHYMTFHRSRNIVTSSRLGPKTQGPSGTVVMMTFLSLSSVFIFSGGNLNSISTPHFVANPESHMLLPM